MVEEFADGVHAGVGDARRVEALDRDGGGQWRKQRGDDLVERPLMLDA